MRSIRRDHVHRRPEQEPVDDAEHRRVRADAESECNDHAGGESWFELEPTHGLVELLRERGPPRGASLGPESGAIDGREAIARSADVAEAPLCFSPSFIRRHPGGHELLHRHLEMEPKLVVDSTVNGGALPFDAHQALESLKSWHSWRPAHVARRT